jgi:hypothetical protein
MDLLGLTAVLGQLHQLRLTHFPDQMAGLADHARLEILLLLGLLQGQGWAH